MLSRYPSEWPHLNKKVYTKVTYVHTFNGKEVHECNGVPPEYVRKNESWMNKFINTRGEFLAEKVVNIVTKTDCGYYGYELRGDERYFWFPLGRNQEGMLIHGCLLVQDWNSAAIKADAMCHGSLNCDCDSLSELSKSLRRLTPILKQTRD